MDRTIVYPQAGVQDTDFLNTNRFAMVAQSLLGSTILGSGPWLSGFACTPGTSLTVSVAAGEIYQTGQVDLTAYGSLSAWSQTVLKQGVALSATVLNCPAPTTAGQSINYLVEIAQEDVDDTAVVLAFYDSSNPSLPYNGPANAGTSLNTVRRSKAVVQVKAGTAATTGSQATPSADSGFVGAYVVTVAYGQASITTGNIAVLGGAPFITETLTQKISAATAAALISAAVATETSRAQGAEASLSSAIGAETSRAEAAEGTLTTNLAAEVTNRTNAVSAETTRATTAEGLLAPKASPTFTGTPAAPTASPGTNTTQLASTAFVQAAVATAVATSTKTSGYVAIGGFIIQWVIGSYDASNASEYEGSLSWPEPFPTACLGAFLSCDIASTDNTSDRFYQSVGWSTTQVNYQLQYASGNHGTVQSRPIAIGFGY